MYIYIYIYIRTPIFPSPRSLFSLPTKHYRHRHSPPSKDPPKTCADLEKYLRDTLGKGIERSQITFGPLLGRGEFGEVFEGVSMCWNYYGVRNQGKLDAEMLQGAARCHETLFAFIGVRIAELVWLLFLFYFILFLKMLRHLISIHPRQPTSRLDSIGDLEEIDGLLLLLHSLLYFLPPTGTIPLTKNSKTVQTKVAIKQLQLCMHFKMKIG